MVMSYTDGASREHAGGCFVLLFGEGLEHTEDSTLPFVCLPRATTV